MNQFLEVMLAIFAAKIVLFMVVLTYLEATLVEPRRPRQRIFRKKAATGTPLGEIAWDSPPAWQAWKPGEDPRHVSTAPILAGYNAPPAVLGEQPHPKLTDRPPAVHPRVRLRSLVNLASNPLVEVDSDVT